MELNEISHEIIGAAIEVHREIGPGLLESTYERALQHELELRGLACRSQVLLPLKYKDLEIPDAYRLDLIVEDAVIVELKTVDSLQPIHEAQLLTYLRNANKNLGLLINFHTVLLRDGIKRMVLNLPSSPRPSPTSAPLRFKLSPSHLQKTPRPSPTSASLRFNSP